MLFVDCALLNAGCWLLFVVYLFVGCWMFVVWLSEVGCWLLVIDNWLVVVDYHMNDIYYWLLVGTVRGGRLLVWMS